MAAAPAASDTAMRCPWCDTWALKDTACNWVCCGLDAAGFHVGAGCGRQWCFACGGKLCGQMFDPATGVALPGVSTSHSDACCGFGTDVCPGGHNSHKARTRILP